MQAMERGYHILNCSLGCGIVEHVLKYKTLGGRRHSCAACMSSRRCNNTDFGRPDWPGSFSSVLSVNMACTDNRQEIYYKPGHLVELAACGVDVEVAWAEGAMTATVTGSSFAAPRVTGMLACMLERSRRKSIRLQAKVLFRRIWRRPWTPEITAPNERQPSS